MTDFLLLAFTFLVAGVIAVPLASRFGLGSVLGYLIAGIVISPILAWMHVDVVAIQHFAEFGVVMMLFLVGLELEPKRLWEMRHKLIGLGGAHLSLAYTPGWTENLTGGRGWIAIALVIFATWDPLRAVVGAVLFGGVNAVQFRLQAAGTTIPAAFLGMLPYLFTIVVLVVITWWEAFSKRVGAPAALGLPYVREERG